MIKSLDKNSNKSYSEIYFRTSLNNLYLLYESGSTFSFPFKSQFNNLFKKASNDGTKTNVGKTFKKALYRKLEDGRLKWQIVLDLSNFNKYTALYTNVKSHKKINLNNSVAIRYTLDGKPYASFISENVFSL